MRKCVGFFVMVFFVCIAQNQVAANFDETFPAVFQQAFNKMRRAVFKRDVIISDELTKTARKWATYFQSHGQTEARWSGNEELYSWGYKNRSPEELIYMWLDDDSKRKAITRWDLRQIGVAKFTTESGYNVWLVELGKGCDKSCLIALDKHKRISPSY